MGRIIVIEDNIIYSDFVCRLLENKGFQCISTFNCNGARKLFAKMQEDDIVLADMRLPDGDGIALLEELRKQSWNNPYIVMTEFGEIPIAVRSLKLGAEDFYPQEPVGNEPAATPESLAETAGTPRSTGLRASERGFP